MLATFFMALIFLPQPSLELDRGILLFEMKGNTNTHVWTLSIGQPSLKYDKQIYGIWSF